MGYVGVESDDVYGDKPHPVPEWSGVLVPWLECTRQVSGVLDVAALPANLCEMIVTVALPAFFLSIRRTVFFHSGMFCTTVHTPSLFYLYKMFVCLLVR